MLSNSLGVDWRNVMNEIEIKNAAELAVGCIVMTPQGRGTIIRKNSGNFCVLLDKKCHRGRAWEQFFEPHEISMIDAPAPASEITQEPTPQDIADAVAKRRKTWLAGLAVGQKVHISGYLALTDSAVVVRLTPTLLVLNNRWRASRESGKLLGLTGYISEPEEEISVPLDVEQHRTPPEKRKRAPGAGRPSLYGLTKKVSGSIPLHLLPELIKRGGVTRILIDALSKSPTNSCN